VSRGIPPSRADTTFLPPPRSAAWLHRDARQGFEVVFFEARGSGYVVSGHTAAVEAGAAWAVDYAITLDHRWQTTRAEVSGRSASGRRAVAVEVAGDGKWLVDGAASPALDGCLDVDLESSALTNAFPVHRLGLEVGEAAQAPAAYVRALDLGVERIEQTYVRRPDTGKWHRYHYESPTFEFAAELEYDEHGLIREYPGIAVRIM
jgi:hypothetical protein